MNSKVAIFENPICPYAMRAKICAIEKFGENNFLEIATEIRDKPKWAGHIYEKDAPNKLKYGDFMGDNMVCIK